MPFLIRMILSRVILGSIGVSAFLGLSSEAEILTDEEISAQIDEQEELVGNIFKNTTNTFAEIIPIISDGVQNFSFSQNENNTSPNQNTSQSPSQNPQSGDNPTVITSQNPITLPEIPTTKPPKTPAEISIENAVVNIVCVTKERFQTAVSTGSGVIISPDGVILTNAHVAQQFLLEGYNGNNHDCTIRRENIPTYGFEASLFYFPEDWLWDHYSDINNPAPLGTGEKDYALLYITGNTNPVLSKPRTFDYIPIETNNTFEKGSSITIAGYPGITSKSFNFGSASSLKKDTVVIKDVFTFNRYSSDVIRSTETPVAAQGASGGAIIQNNHLIGIIFSTSEEGVTNSVNGISLSYINRDLSEKTNTSLQSFISTDVAQKIETFNKEKFSRFQSLLARGFDLGE